MKEYIMVTGMSGSGKTKAMKILEDKGYYCVDNLPLKMISLFLEEMETNHKEETKVAISLDIRSLDFIENIEKIINTIDGKNTWNMMFLDAEDDILIKRYKETRRKHPYAEQGSIEQGIEKEREMLKNLKRKAKYIIDTTNVTEKELKKIIEEKMIMDENDMLVNFMSFGYKYGLPKDVDLLFDVRLLPNPYYVEELRKETGLKKEVSDYVYENEEAKKYYQETVRYLEYLLPMYEKEGRKQFIVGIGCTGGKHRSVATTEKIKEFFAGKYKVVVSHRDLGRE